MELHYLPPYWLNLAPIKLIFYALKKRISVIKSEGVVDFSKPSDKKRIIEGLRLIGKEKWRNMWSHFVKESKRFIIEVKEKEGDGTDASQFTQ